MINEIGTRIRKARERKGISQEAMALELEITQSNYGRLEKNDTRQGKRIKTHIIFMDK